MCVGYFLLLKIKGWKKIYNQNKVGVALLMSSKIDFEPKKKKTH